MKRDVTALTFDNAHPEGRTSSEQRHQIREMVWWLKGDLYERVPAADFGADPDTTMVMQMPLKWTVLLAPRKDGTGWLGEVRNPFGEWVSTTSFADIHWLEDKLP